VIWAATNCNTFNVEFFERNIDTSMMPLIIMCTHRDTIILAYAHVCFELTSGTQSQ
jgi:hypothetical protein